MQSGARPSAPFTGASLGSTRIPVAPFASLARVYAIFVKELIQRRDRITFATMILSPGAVDAVRLRHQHRPEAPAHRCADPGRQRVHALLYGSAEDERVFRRPTVAGERSRPPHLFRRGPVRVQIPANSPRRGPRGASILVVADAPNPIAAESNRRGQRPLDAVSSPRIWSGIGEPRDQGAASGIHVHRQYDPDQVRPGWNIVPGLDGPRS